MPSSPLRYLCARLSLRSRLLTPGIHLNFHPMGVPKGASVSDLDELDTKAMARALKWGEWGTGYRIEHSTKPATIGAILDSSPVAMLCWIGEKLEGIMISDRARKLHFILADLSLYWFTNTAGTCLWEYRSVSPRRRRPSLPPLSIHFPSLATTSPSPNHQTQHR